MESNNDTTLTFQQLIENGVLEIGDGYRAKNNELGGNGPIFLRAGHVNDSYIDFEGVEKFRSLDVEKLRPKMARIGDTIITTKGNSTGRTSFVTERMPHFVYSPHLSYWRSKDKNLIASGFLRYWSRSSEFQSQLVAMKTSTDMAPYLSLTDQRRLKITLLPIIEQLAIANILGSLDDKIDLNRRMNETLEGMAQALFKSWFVDFDPVIDNALVAGNPIPEELADRAEVRRAALTNGTANREAAKPFPAAFQSTEELGWIPVGWEVKEIRERTKTIQYGLTQSACDEECGPKFLRITDIRGGKINWNEVPFCEVTPDELEKYGVGEGDIFVARTGASTGENVYVTRPMNAVFASYLVRFTFEQKEIGRIVGMFMRSSRYSEHIAGILGGSAQPNASAQMLASASMVFPSEAAAELFYKKVSVMDERRAANDSESRNLTKLRDTLLPKLISGELRIPEAEKLAEAALS